MEKITEFKILNREIPGLLEIDITLIEDARGWFTEKFQKQKLVDQGFPKEFNPVQQSVSYNRAEGIIRGIHAEPWDKYISVITGKVYAVFVDLRQKNFGKKVEITITPSKAVFVPKGVGNSFQTLEPDTYYSYLVNDHWSPARQEGYKFVNLADPDLDIRWPISLDDSIISEKDKNHPYLKDVIPFEL
jgi:dTDP-4-dehydrorhamnose 3,5-epimerase